MTELHACYFCGDAAGLGTYQVVPPRLDPDEAEQRTVRLCPTCRDKLMEAMEPLVERAEGSDGDPAASGDGLTPPADDTGDPAGGVDRDEVAGDDGATADDDGATTPADADDEEPAAVDGEEPGDVDSQEPGDVDDDDPGDVDSEEPAEVEGDDAAGDDSDSDGPHPLTNAAAADDGGDVPRPTGYGKVMRLLENREFPVERKDAEIIAMNAYDLTAPEFDAIVAAAVERGRLVDDGDALRRP